MFDAETYHDRRSRLRQALDSGLILFLGHEESPLNYKDNPSGILSERKTTIRSASQ